MSRTRAGHASLDISSRERKANKIAELMKVSGRSPSTRMLEIGTGSGQIANYFGKHGRLGWEVESIDVQDVRVVKDGYRFQLVDGTQLPFEDGSFDVVISNHVIEHVGEESAQLRHLEEIRRVLAPDGSAYLAVPNRWMLVEPHYRLAFLSWIPRRWRSSYLRWRRGIPEYDCEPLTLPAAERLMREAGLAFENLTVPALRRTLEMEWPRQSLLRRFIEVLPDRLIESMRAASPTLIFRLSRASPASKDATAADA